MQFGRFHTGGYYLHKIAGNWKGTVSTWFDRDGNLLDAEQITRPFGSSRKVKRGGPMWATIRQVGLRYKAIPAA